MTIEPMPEPKGDPLEIAVATIMCQHRRTTRDMPRTAEIEQALPLARSIIRMVRNTKP